LDFDAPFHLRPREIIPMRPSALRLLTLLGLFGILLAACAPTPTPGEKDRERGEDAVDRLPK
jgi:hypothetical protein